ncbi:uncharacterized protein LOC564114 [Danio rerio]|uniref:Si:dkey-58f10.7 n=1 Tax=Danio rerio TaxID=7955 RepID=A2BHJ8_DANRE|nr:uncharacterized protein LOC564114 [Danio rerio]|eukprot:NP_001121722.1 uncharacterized protein LOC564114 [Danio rerio]
MSQLKAIPGKYYYVIESGSTDNLPTHILSHLQQQRPNLVQVYSVDQCDVILVLCPIISRAGTDIDAALKKLNDLSAFKPAIFIVLHQTFDPERVVLDSSTFVKRMNTLTVDCLFFDTRLLRCNINDEALDKIVTCFKHQTIANLPIIGTFLIRLLSFLSKTIANLPIIGTFLIRLLSFLSKTIANLPIIGTFLIRLLSFLSKTILNLPFIGPCWNRLSSFISQTFIGDLWNQLPSIMSQNKKRQDSDEERSA